jgi:cation diffusion facilitator family transporter
LGQVTARPESSRRKRSAAWLSVVSNAAAVIVKLATAVVTGSSAVLSEAAHSAGDLSASVIALVSVRAADRPADSGHPFGHEKIEHVSGVIEGALIVAAASAVAVLALTNLGSPVEHSNVGIIVMLAAAAVNVVVARRVRRVGHETQSAALEADAAHLSADVVTSLGAAAALVLVDLTDIAELDGLIACGIALLVARTGVRLVVQGTRVLVDEAIPDDEVATIRGVLEGADGVTGWHRLRARRAGSIRHIDLHLLVDPGMSVARSHRITDRIEAQLKERLGGADVVIHVEPATSEPEEDASLL